MKVKLVLILAILLLSLAYCSANASDNPVLTGGYEKISVDAQDVKDCVKFLETYFPTEKEYENLKIKEVKEAYSQVVAGRNIKLICAVDNKVQDKIMEETWEFIVYINLDNVYKLTSAKKLEAVMPGGYEKISVEDESVKDCVKFLERYFKTKQEYENLKIKEVKEAYSQVVAGRNIKLICMVDNKVQDKTVQETWEFIIYINLEQVHKVESCKKIN